MEYGPGAHTALLWEENAVGVSIAGPGPNLREEWPISLVRLQMIDHRAQRYLCGHGR